MRGFFIKKKFINPLETRQPLRGGLGNLEIIHLGIVLLIENQSRVMYWWVCEEERRCPRCNSTIKVGPYIIDRLNSIDCLRGKF